jgi:hypothetical protein
MLLAALTLLLAIPPARPFNEERLLLDRRLEALRRILPDGANPPADVALVRELAEAAKLQRIALDARSPTESGARGEVTVDLVAFGRFADIDRFFRQVALSPRLVDVDSLALTATNENVIRLTAALRLSFRPARAPLPAPPETRNRPSGVPRPALEAFQRDQAIAFAKSETVVQLRRTRRNPRLFLAELAAVMRDRPVVLSYASLGEEFLVRGLAMGDGPVRGLESRLERGFFRISEFLMARHGACHRFEVRGQSPVAGIEAELPLPSEDPFEQDETPCRVDRDPARSTVVKAPGGKNPGKGPLTVRLREVDAADVFHVLHLLTGQAFLVDDAVAGRLSFDFSRVSLEEALSALRKAGVEVTDAAALRRVSPSKTTAGPAASGGVPKASFALKRVDVRELLAVMTDLEPALAALGPPGFLGRVSLWARDLSVVDLQAAVVDAVGLTQRLEEGRRILERRPASEEPPTPVAGTPAERRLVLGPQDLAVMEFELAGVASAGQGYIAFAYSPAGQLNAYRPGDRLADGVVTAVESTDVVIETEEGPVRYPLSVLR